MICPIFNCECRFCSQESLRTIRDACDLKTHGRVMIRDIVPLGAFCNNTPIGESGWIEDIKICYSTWLYIIPDTKK
jgi:hypothetical protein